MTSNEVEMDLRSQIDNNNIPRHLAVIMDGNGRWAQKQGLLRVKGHESGVKAVQDTVEGCAELGVKYLTLYAFSTENWNRPKLEVTALMSLLVSTLKKEVKTLMENNIRLRAIGNIEQLPSKARKELQEVIQLTSENTHMTLSLALSYSSKNEISNAVKCIASKVRDGVLTIDDIDNDLISDHLYTNGMPDVDLLIRTSGECRISNFLLWQIAYAELYFTDVLWPDFRKDELQKAILSYQGRERRFGKTSEQIDNH